MGFKDVLERIELMTKGNAKEILDRILNSDDVYAAVKDLNKEISVDLYDLVIDEQEKAILSGDVELATGLNFLQEIIYQEGLGFASSHGLRFDHFQRIVIGLAGGLGAQMGQYALGRRLALKNKAHLEFDTSYFPDHKQRTFRLNRLNTNCNIFEKNSQQNNTPFKVLQTNQDLFGSPAITTKDNLYLYECWTSHKYFQDIRPILTFELTPKDPVSKESQKLLDEIENCNSIGVHIRRGDYVSDPTVTVFHGFCTNDYFNAATEITNTRIKTPCYYVFSDDIEWAKNNFIPSFPTQYINGTGADQDIEDMLMMSKCKHNIISNSSFSWWGAWLNNNPQKIIVAPKQWFKSEEINFSNICPPEWIKI